ncbi:spore germination protein [Brevibacillus dissolubilis]|uniref:spore germination protein n=1 Tax=Brevibacillus dissolubilis TaxID=1844116 RepID=UPI001116F040|nr:spore germination protein [Brevibacillus dissolubilis]
MRMDKHDSAAPLTQVPPQLESLTVESLQELFYGCSDVKIKEFTMGDAATPQRVVLIYCEGLSDVMHINKDIFPRLNHLFHQHSIQNASDLDQNRPLPMYPLNDDLDANEIVDRVFSGNLLLFFEQLSCLYWAESSDPPKRNPEETSTDTSIRGPRDGFTEELIVNVALVRKRLKTPQLHYEQFILGTQYHTVAGLLYVENQMSQDLLSSIRHKLASIKIEGIVSMTQLEELLTNKRFQLLPIFEYTGRPDFVVNALLHGKFVILLNGSPTAIIAPVDFTFLLNTPEDAENPFLFVAFTRLLRIIGVVLALFLPGFWVSLITFHQDQLPYTLIATLVMSRQGVPLPASLEAFLMLFLFELFREAGLRLPSAVGQTISVVGGLIVGEAAISAGLTAPGILVIIAISVMSTFTLVNQNLVSAVVLLRIVTMLICSFLGLFGFMMCIMGVLVYFTNVRSFGVYYFTPISPFIRSDIYKTIFRIPWRSNYEKPDSLNPTFAKEGKKK